LPAHAETSTIDFHRTVDLAMDYAALIHQARTSVSSGAYAKAVVQFEQARTLHKESSVALAGLGHCYGKLGRHLEAARCLTQAAQYLRGAKSDDSVNAILDVAHEMHAIHAFRESLAVISKALKQRSTSARAHYLKAQALLRLNDLEGACKSAMRARLLAPDDHNASLLMADLETRRRNYSAAIALLEPLVTAQHTPHYAQAMFQLGHILDRLGDYQAAFEHVREAGVAKLKQATVARFDMTRIHTELAEKQRLCTPQWCAKHGYQGNDHRAAPIFLIGFYRSGTTLAEQILAAHPRLVSSDEADLLTQVYRELHRRQPDPTLHWTDRLAACGPDAAAQMRAYYWQCVEHRFGPLGKDVLFLDKTALNTINIDLIVSLFPDARIVFALRDPRDVLISCFLQNFTPTPLTAHLLDWHEAARFYATVMHFWEQMRESHRPQVNELRYEDVLSDQRAAFSPLMESLGLDWHPAMSDFHLTARERVISTPSFAEVTRPLYRSSLARWRHYAARFDDLGELLAPFLSRYGYHQRGDQMASI
jgi:tetratricopeptide (TPR) repeat protein